MQGKGWDNIPGGREEEKDMKLRRSLQRGSIKEALNYGLNEAVVETNKWLRKRQKCNGGESGLSIIYTYTQVDNGLRLKLNYLKVL